MKRKNLILKKEIEIFKSDKHWKWILQTDILRIPKEEKKSKGTEKNSKNFKKYFLKLEKKFLKLHIRRTHPIPENTDPQRNTKIYSSKITRY